jgi:ABC-type dipeptide/oligopeptide/nickel transport system permease component
MATFVIRRLLVSIVVLAGVSVCVFLMLHLIPGDPAEVMLSEQGGSADVQALRHDLGLDRPLYVQYGLYIKRVLSGDLGESIRLRLPVRELIQQRAPKTLELTAAALFLAAVGGIFAGVLSAVYRGRLPDHAAMLGALVGVSLPSFWLGLMLILLFGVHLQWLPIAGADEPGSIVLPAVTLAAIPLAIIARLMRSSLLEVLDQDYIRTARAKGLPERRVIRHHALKNALLPVVTLVGLQAGAIIEGAIITETIFFWPGVGRLAVESIAGRDYPVVQTIVLCSAFSFMLSTLVVDLVYAWLDPRISYAGARR